MRVYCPCTRAYFAEETCADKTKPRTHLSLSTNPTLYVRFAPIHSSHFDGWLRTTERSRLELIHPMDLAYHAELHILRGDKNKFNADW